MSYVYIIAADPAGPCKIGFSKDPEKRLRQLQTGYPGVLRIFHRIEFPGKAPLIEGILHRTLNHCRVRREWFNIDVETATAELEFALIRYGD